MSKEFQRIPTVGSPSEGGAPTPGRFGWRSRLPPRLAGAFVVVAPPFEETVAAPGAPLFETVWSLCGETVASSRTSRVERIRWPGLERPGSVAPPAGTAYLKRYWYPTWRDRLKAALRNTFLGPSRCAREWHHLRALNDRGLSPLRPIAMGEWRRLGFLYRSFIITEALPGGLAASNALRQVHGPQQIEMLGRLGAWIGRLHHAGFSHGGLHLRNIVALPDGRFAAIDPPGARWHRGSIRLRRAARRDLRAIIEDLGGTTSPAEIKRVLESYLGDGATGPALARLERLLPPGERS